MKNLLPLLLFALFIAACSPKDSVPTDVPGMRTLVKEKKAQIKILQDEIEALNQNILTLEPKKEKDPILVTTQILETRLFERFTDVQAAVQSDDEVFVSSETGGRLLVVNAKEGQSVKRGQLIATLDMQSIKDQKAELETSIVLAKDVFDRQQKLWDQNIGSEIQFLQAKNNYERLQKSLVTINTQISKANVYAPISGVVNMELLKPGEMASPGAPIVQLFNPYKLKVAADVPESYIGKINKGDEVKIKFPALDTEMTKSVSLLGRTIDPSNRTFKVEVLTNNPGGLLKPNLLAEVQFRDFVKDDAIVVPLEIVQQEVTGNKYVFTSFMEADKLIAKKSYIVTGESFAGNIIVEDGLQAGDKIIIEGARSVVNGDPIKDLTK